jgi:peptide/nickel transport system substrate-binding protein
VALVAGEEMLIIRTRYCDTNSGSDSVASGAAIFGYHNDTLNDLGTQELQELDDEKRKEIVYEMQTVLADDIPTIPLYYTTKYDAWRISTYDGWVSAYDHHAKTHCIFSYLERD